MSDLDINWRIMGFSCDEDEVYGEVADSNLLVDEVKADRETSNSIMRETVDLLSNFRLDWFFGSA